MPIPVDDAIDILRAHISDQKTLNAIAKDLIAAEKENKQAHHDNSAPKAKSRLVVLIRGDTSLKRLVEGGAWVVAVPDSADGTAINPTPLLDRIGRAVKTFNEALKKNRANRVIRVFARAMEKLTPKAIKNAGGDFKIKTKQPVEVVVVEQEAV